MTVVLDTKTEQANELIEKELEAARIRLQPISRRRLIGIVSKKFDLSAHQAEQIVEEYCEAKAPATPEYLGKEWFLPYVKLMALFLSLVGIVAVAWGADRWHNHLISWPFFLLGAVAIFFGGVGLLKAIRGEVEIAEEQNAFPAVE